MLKKNEIITIEITGMTNEGNGVGKYNDIAVFVPYTAVGDVIECRIVKVKKSFCYGIIEKIITPSKSRQETDCPVFKKCGGCSFRHFSYDEELRVKYNFVKDSFERIGKLDVPYEPILGCETINGYRNKAQYPVAEIDGKIVCGFFSKRSHRVTAFTECKLQPPVFRNILEDCMDYANKSTITAYNEFVHSGLLRHIYIRRGEHSKEIMVCFVVTDLKKYELFIPLADMLSKKYVDIKSIVINENSRKTNVILGDKTKVIYGSETIYDMMCSNRIEISPLSFYQVNTVQAEKLYKIAAEYAELKGNELLLDLYCGAGTIGLSMAEKVRKLIGVEIIEPAIENAKKNAKTNQIDNAEFICGDAEKIAEILYERGERPDVIIADPARKGCSEETLKYMAKMAPERIVMISCNHTTAARDCAILDKLGYKAVKCRAVDLFPRSTHVETVVLLSQQRPNDKIRVELDLTEFDITAAEKEATYQEIKDYILEKHGVKVSSLYIAQVKEKLGIKERENYNLPKNADSKQPQCPKEKEKMIVEALKHFKMI